VPVSRGADRRRTLNRLARNDLRISGARHRASLQGQGYDKAQAGDVLVLEKSLGIGVLSAEVSDTGPFKFVKMKTNQP
jgi:selenophosphate synthase